MRTRKFSNAIRALRRAPASGRYMPEVDGLRALAIGIVVIGHAFKAWMRGGGHSPEGLLAQGWPAPLLTALGHPETGVLLFFAISGYVLAMPFAQMRSAGRTVSLKNYYLRRLIRIEPPYFIITTGILIALLLDGTQSLYHYGPHYAASMGYVHSLAFSQQNGLNDVAWSLEVEVQFYLVAPLIFLVFRLTPRARNTALILLLALGAVAAWWWRSPVLWLLPFAVYFLIGTAAAALMTTSWRPGRRGSVALAVLAAASLIVMQFLNEYLPPGLFPTLAPLLVGFLLLGGIASRPWQRLLSVGALPIVGGMCYSIYLTHNLLLIFLVKYGLLPGINESSPSAFLSMLGCGAVLVLLMGAVVFILVEQPFMRLGRRFPLLTDAKTKTGSAYRLAPDEQAAP